MYILKPMDIAFVYQGQRFVWDVRKASTNLAKHGVSFEEACQVFFDPLLHVEDATIGEEPRHAVIGLTENWALLFVVHVLREDDVLRIISARPATAQERRLYEDCD
jgi:uncharacterized protein